MKYTAAVITVSDMGSRGLRQDTSGPAVRAMLEKAGFSVAHTTILPDEMEQISAELRDCADRRRIDLIVTTGGTGLSPRDVTPEATRAVLEREIPAIPVAMWTEITLGWLSFLAGANKNKGRFFVLHTTLSNFASD